MCRWRFDFSRFLGLFNPLLGHLWWRVLEVSHLFPEILVDLLHEKGITERLQHHYLGELVLQVAKLDAISPFLVRCYDALLSSLSIRLRFFMYIRRNMIVILRQLLWLSSYRCHHVWFHRERQLPLKGFSRRSYVGHKLLFLRRCPSLKLAHMIPQFNVFSLFKNGSVEIKK